MKTNKQAKRKLLGITLALLLVIGAHAQVTIGMGKEPNQGSLLDLKENDPDGNNVTAKKGLLLPRVNLTKKYTLEDIDPSNSVRPNEEAHTGLTVYSINKCDLDGDGVYVWMGDQWQKLSSASTVPSVNADKTFFDFPSGRDLRTLSEQTLNMTWANGMSPTPPTWSLAPGDLASNNLSFSKPSGTTGSLATSPQAIQLLPPAMSVSEIANNPFLAKDIKILFQYDMGANGCKKSTSVQVRQTNKALLINGSTFIPQKSYTTTTNGETFSVTSNAQWKLSIYPAANSAVSGLVPALGSVQGKELYDGTADTPVTQTFNVASDGTKKRYNFLIFSDVQTPKRFVDVTQSIIQCSVEQEMTMEEWKDMWEEFYGLDPAQEEPNSDGDISKNKNRVQWHRDQDGNAFFSAMFGNQRWMTTNLAATSYAPDSPNKPPLTITYDESYNDAHIGYPNPVNTPSALAGSKTFYNKRQRLGMLYNWTAASGISNAANIDQGNINHTPLQGICPTGWHLPTHWEWLQLIEELKDNPTKYSDNADYEKTGITAKDICEPGLQGKSLDPLAGGFNAMLIGAAGDGKMIQEGQISFFWSCSINLPNRYYCRLDAYSNKLVMNSNSPATMFTVKCVKD
ncbi:FISUMP domain-containing protein [Prevotella sp. 10(H)]|uniref:FISUMP domain-containing protein n=1 Tax=Prevotella sp. 10(H) TaxID=1158294 RepID=UPI00068B016D|nr:FISUMP domain-containing protein [Prevotella sp. 10(H)]